MAANIKAQMQQARDLIKAKKYSEARSILEGINHPKAQEWLSKIEQMAQSGSTSTPQATGRGNEIETFGVNKTETGLRFVVAIILVVLVIAVSFYVEWDAFTVRDRENFMFLMAAVLFIPGSIWLFSSSIPVLIKGRKTIIYSNGVVRNDEYYSWEQITGIKGEIKKDNDNDSSGSLLTTGKYTLYQGDEALFDLTAFDENVHRQHSYINGSILETHTQPMIQRVRAGETLQFGELEVKADGLYFKDKYLSFAEFSKVNINNSLMTILDRNGNIWKAYSTGGFFNLPLFLVVINELTQNSN